MKIIQINTLVNSGSTGRIAESIGKLLIDQKHESYIAYGRGNQSSESKLIKVGNSVDQFCHGVKTRLFDKHGFGSRKPTYELIKTIEVIQPDLIHLHNLHGYYINIELLFEYFRISNIPIVWTFHDCWPFTGHCSYFERVNCLKWQTECFNCPNSKEYPGSWFIDNSRENFLKKRELFTGVKNMTLVSPSKWLANHLNNSFLKDYPIEVINNGIDLEKFRPVDSRYARQKYHLGNRKFLLGVANIWDKRKGLADFAKLRSVLDLNIDIVLVGLNLEQIKKLPEGIKGLTRTDSIDDLVALYSAAEIFINPTHTDNFPTTNIEAIACGTPIITYNTGGCPEAIDEQTGRVISKGDITSLLNSVLDVLNVGKEQFSILCRNRAESLYKSDDRYMDYLKLYENLTKQTS